MLPADNNGLHGSQAVMVARAATAHNDGETVLESFVDGGVVSIKMSSWPRAREAMDAFLAQGWETCMGKDECGQWIHVRPAG